jgi:hypothetical protein
MCNVYESRLDSVEAGAPAKEIEITPEMIEVGCEAISRFFSFELDDPERVVSSVFSAMAMASPSTRVPIV